MSGFRSATGPQLCWVKNPGEPLLDAASPVTKRVYMHVKTGLPLTRDRECCIRNLSLQQSSLH